MVVSVDENNTLNVENNVSLADNWAYPEYYLNPYNNCEASGPVGFAIFQGNYGLNNFTHAPPLTLYNSTYAWSCSTILTTNSYYVFSPLSMVVSWDNSGWKMLNFSTAFSFSASGYWTGGFMDSSLAVFHRFSPGNYTVFGADEWGKVVILHFTVMSGFSTGTSTFTTGPLTQYSTGFSFTGTTTAPGFNDTEAAMLLLNSTEVTSYLKSAYSYTLSVVPDPFSSDISFWLFNVTETQNVSGNWSGSGYTIIYGGIMTLNATVQFSQPNNYQLIAVGVTNYPNAVQTISYSPQQQQVISVAVSNNTVQSYMRPSQFYVTSVTQLPMGNESFAGDYLVNMNLVNNESAVIQVYVNPSITAVVSASYEAGFGSGECFGGTSDACFNSPWS
jgi:hypothetical protein